MVTCTMPVVFWFKRIKFFFFSNEGSPREPVHIHVRKGIKLAKFWVNPRVTLAQSYGFSARELSLLIKVIEARRQEIEEAWNEYFNT